MEKNNNNKQSIIEIEKSVLSHAFQSRSKDVDEIFLQLTAEDFTDFRHRIIFSVINKLRNEGKTTDLLTVVSYMDLNQEIQFNDYRNYLSNVFSQFTYDSNLLQFLDIIKNNSIQNKILDFAKMLNETNLDVITSKEKLWSLEKDFLNITSNKKSKEIESLDKIVTEYHKKLEHIKGLNTEMTGVSSGYISLDKITHGFQGGDLIILAARPGIGKTALAINFLVNAANELRERNKEKPNEKPQIVLMFSMEMGNLQVCQRIVSLESNIDVSTLRKGTWDENQWHIISESISSLYSLPLYLDDTSDLSILDIQSKIKQISHDKEIKLIVIDYLQLLKGTSKQSNLNRQQEVAIISRSLKSIARQYNVPIIAIAQLSRKIEERKGDAKRPLLSDLRESGSIEQDADLVCFINYKEDNAPKENTNNNWENVMVEFIIAKNRNGSVGSIDLIFSKSISRYYDANIKK